MTTKSGTDAQRDRDRPGEGHHDRRQAPCAITSKRSTKDAPDYIRALAARTERLFKSDIREIHRIVLGRVDPAEAGAVQPASACDPLLIGEDPVPYDGFMAARLEASLNPMSSCCPVR